MVTNSNDYSDIYHYRGQAMKLINDTLDDPVARVSNETLGGLCHLVMVEGLYGSPAAASVHRKGLQRLLELRRAVPGTSMNLLVRRILPLTNLQLPSENSIPNPTECLPDSIPGQGTSNTEALNQPDRILQVFSWLKDTPLELPFNPSATESPSCLVQVKLEYNIYTESKHHSSTKSRRCWLIAALVYLHTIIATPGGWHLLPKFEAHLVADLRDLMEQMMQDSLDVGFGLGVHVWILLFGGVHARGEDAAWFRKALRELSEEEGIPKWDDVKLLTQDLPWVQKNLEKCLEDFYTSCRVSNYEQIVISDHIRNRK